MPTYDVGEKVQVFPLRSLLSTKLVLSAGNVVLNVEPKVPWKAVPLVIFQPPTVLIAPLLAPPLPLYTRTSMYCLVELLIRRICICPSLAEPAL